MLTPVISKEDRGEVGYKCLGGNFFFLKGLPSWWIVPALYKQGWAISGVSEGSQVFEE